MANVITILPELKGEEQAYIQSLIKEMSEEEAQQFATVYRARRKDPQIILLLTVVGFLGIAGIQRFVVDQIGMGLLYLLTGGICLIGTIVDLVTYQSIAFQYNQVQANQAAAMLKDMRG